MAYNTSLGARNKLSATASSIKTTPSSSPSLKPGAKQPPKSPYQCNLSLRTVIGTTTSNPNGFSYHEPSRTFALCAGSAAVLAEFDENLTISQRFFRARPAATGVNVIPSHYNNSSAPPFTPDTRSKGLQITLGSGNGISAASSPNDFGEQSSPRTWSSRERIKAVTSVALSPNGRFLAVGEAGYIPRVLIFSTAKDSPSDIPLSILAEHSFGVRSLAFSPDSQYLATLGDVNDGFLFVWAINLRNGAARLHSANKCTSFVRDMCWLGNAFVTVGVRHIKIWRLGEGPPTSPAKAKSVPDPNPATTNAGPIALSGRNCILGTLRDCVFTCISNLSDNEAIVCTDTGAVCLLDDTTGQQKLQYAKSFGVGISSAAVDNDSGVVFFGCRDGTIRQVSIEDLRAAVSTSDSISNSTALQSPNSKTPFTLCMGILLGHIVAVDSMHAIKVFTLPSQYQEQIQIMQGVGMPAHTDSIRGIKAVTAPNVLSSSQFFTWSCNGTVSFWDLEGSRRATQQVKIESLTGNNDEANELRVLRASEDMETFVSGDKHGMIRVIGSESWTCKHEARAHAGEITDIAIHSDFGLLLIATCGRDRMVQVFLHSEDSFDLMQTMDEHVAVVNQLLFTSDGEKLLSCSSDRTVIIRNRITRDIDNVATTAFIISNVITLRSSPVSMTFLSNGSDILFLSTMDRQIHRYEISSNRLVHSFKATDPETNDTAVIGSLTVGSEVGGVNTKVLVGVSASDKSIRVYDFSKDAPLTREFAHTEGVSDVLLIETYHKDGIKKTLVSAGMDGIIMIWDMVVLLQPQQELLRADDEPPSKELAAAKPPLRRILSRSELAGFQKTESPSPCPIQTRNSSPPAARRRVSRFNLARPSRPSNGASPSTAVSTPSSRRSPTLPADCNGKARRDGSVSPPSPKSSLPRPLGTKSSNAKLRRPSLDYRRTKSRESTSEFGSLKMSTEQVCRTLRAYRQKLQTSTDPTYSAIELKRELELTVQALNNLNKRTQTSEDSTDSDKLTPSLPARPVRFARRVPSTPNLGHPRKTNDKQIDRVYRANSLDADGEG